MSQDVQLRFPSLRRVRPPRPTIRDERVALAIAKRIVTGVNPDNFHWDDCEIKDRIFDVQQEIMRCGRPATVFGRLRQRQPPVSCDGRRSAHPYGWEGIAEDCREIADEIAQQELATAVVHYIKRYGKD